MLGLNTRIDAYILKFALELLVSHLRKLRARHSSVALAQDAKLLCYGNCRVNMVAGYHNRADAGGLALVDSILNLRAHGVDHSRKAHKAELLLERLRLAVVRLRAPYAQSAGQNSQGLIGHCLIIIEYLTAVVIGHWNSFAVFEIMRTFSDDNIGRALCVLNNAVRGKVQGAHHFSAGVKRRFAAAWQ